MPDDSVHDNSGADSPGADGAAQGASDGDLRWRIELVDGEYVVPFDPGGDHVATTFVLALSTITGRDVTELPTLADHVDVDALEALFDSDRSNNLEEGSVYLDLGDYSVTVFGDGTMVISPRDDPDR